MAIVYHNGGFLDEEQASIPITDRGFLFGDGIFTTVKVVDGEPQLLEKHLDRLFRQCEMLKIESPMIPEAAIEELIDQNHAWQGVWRMKIIVTGGCEPALSLPKRPCGQVLMTIKSYEGTRESVTLSVYPYPVIRPISGLKTLAYLDRLCLKEYALQEGADDALVLSPEGYVMETAFSNIFWCSEKALYTPSRELPLMQGIALEECCEEACNRGMEVVEVKARLDELTPEMKVFTCNSMTGAIPVTRIGDRVFAGLPLSD
jgi:4-amino-4-deoxychorismate lyase